jgi:hypothetical protein
MQLTVIREIFSKFGLFQRKKILAKVGLFGGMSCQLETFAKFLAKFRLNMGCTGTCQHVCSCVHSYEICELLQLFDPSFIEENDITAAQVARLEVIVPFGARPILMAELQRDVHLYVAASAGFTSDHGDVGDFTAGILTWWKNHATEVGAWSEAAVIAFAMAPNSAGAERAFSMLKTLPGSNQDSALADFIRGSMMLHYNNSKRASEAAKA